MPLLHRSAKASFKSIACLLVLVLDVPAAKLSGSQSIELGSAKAELAATTEDAATREDGATRKSFMGAAGRGIAETRPEVTSTGRGLATTRVLDTGEVATEAAATFADHKTGCNKEKQLLESNETPIKKQNQMFMIKSTRHV